MNTIKKYFIFLLSAFSFFALVNISAQAEEEQTEVLNTQANVGLSLSGSAEEDLNGIDDSENSGTVFEENILGQKIEIPEDPDEKPSIYLNFENASLASVLNYLADQKNINIIPDKKLEKQKVSLTTRHALTLKQAWDILYTLLEMNGFALINVNGLYRVVSMKDHQKNPLPVFSSSNGVTPEDLPDNDKIVRYIYFCRNIKVATAKGILEKVLSKGAVQVNRDLEACIITDKSHTIKSGMKIVTELDQGGLRESIKIIKLKHTNAESIAKLFNEQIIGKAKEDNKQRVRFTNPQEQQASTYFSDETKIIPEPIQNTLILMGSESNINRIIDFVSKYIDVPLGNAQSRLHIKEIKYMAAEKIKQLLEKVLAPPKGQGKDKSLLEGKFKFFEDVIIVAETAKDGDKGVGSGNRLIISASNEDWIRLNKFIDKLDKPQPQVALEIMIVDIKLEDDRALGGQARPPKGAFGNVEAQTLPLGASEGFEFGKSQLPFAGGKGSTIISLGNGQTDDNADVWGIIKALYKIDHSNVISQPFLIANNNTKCVEEISTTRLVDGQLSSGSNGTQRRTKETVTAAVKTTILPRINAGGVIELDIDIIVDEFQKNSSVSPDTTNRSIKTHALMYTGEVLVIGGLNDSKHSKKSYKTPILGDIPILGNLFKKRDKSSAKKNLYVFIRPSIIKPHFSGMPDDYTQLKLDYAKYQVSKTNDFVKSKDPIERIFFKPGKQSIKQKLADMAQGRMRVIDNFAEKSYMPREVQISRDPYYRVSREVNTGRKISGEFKKSGVKETLVVTPHDRSSEIEKEALDDPVLDPSLLISQNKKQALEKHQEEMKNISKRSRAITKKEMPKAPSLALSEKTLSGLLGKPTHETI